MLKVVIIDDCKSTLKYMDNLLTNIGHKVFTFNRPKDAINIIPSIKPDIIICDYMMIDMVGTDVIDSLRKVYTTPIQYILLTSMHDEELVKYCGKHNITYIQKLGSKTKILEGIKCLA